MQEQQEASSAAGWILARGQAHQPTIVTESTLPAGTTETQVSSPLHGRSTSRRGSAGAAQIYEGRPPQGEDNVGEALHRLRDHLNHPFGRVVWREHVGHADVRIDGTLEVVGEPDLQVLCQVTRVERGTLQSRGARRSGNRAESSLSDDELAGNILAAVESKQTRADSTVVLVLDTNDAPAYTEHVGIIDCARILLVSAALTEEWRAIWTVGPTINRTHWLDGDRLGPPPRFLSAS